LPVEDLGGPCATLEKHPKGVGTVLIRKKILTGIGVTVEILPENRGKSMNTGFARGEKRVSQKFCTKGRREKAGRNRATLSS